MTTGKKTTHSMLEWTRSTALSSRAVALAAALSVTFAPVNALAIPQGGVVSAGQASIVSSGNQLTVNQTSGKAIIDWSSFNVAPNEAVTFNQPSSSSITLNRVNDINPSSIQGQITANGTVVLVNPNGVFFGPNSKVDVSGLIATSADIANSDFMAGNMNFSKPGNPNASIVNQGTITAADAGLVGLVAPSVENSGVINARLGKATLASGDTFTLDLAGDQLISVAVSADQLPKQAVSNSGTIQADGGTVTMTAAAARKVVNSLVSNSGTIQANRFGTVNGHIMLYAEGSHAVSGNVTANKGQKSGTSVAQNSGTISTSGKNSGESGGSISVLGDNVSLLSGSLLDVSGDKGGGTIQVGGDFHGAGTTPTAITTYVDANARIFADAITSGNGGNVTVWADGSTAFAGSITARGGAISGNGGYVETSGHQYLSYTGTVVANSPNGQSGTLLLDPEDITISTSANSDETGSPNFVPGNTQATSVIQNSTINTLLNSGTSVSVTTSSNAQSGPNGGSITVNAALTASGAGNASLTLSAYNNITINTSDTITLNGTGVLTLTANTGGGGGTITTNAALTTSTGAVNLSGYGVSGSSAGTITTSNDPVNITTTGSGSGTFAGAITAGSGLITFNIADSTTASGIISNSAGVTKSGLGKLTLSNGSNSYTGGTNINAGTLNFVNGSLGTTGNITFGGGTLQYAAGNTQDISARLKNSTSGAITIDTVNNNVTYASIIDNSNTNGLTLNSSGTGQLTLSGSNTFTGGLSVLSGTVVGKTSANALGADVTNGAGKGNITLGNTSGSANATLVIGSGADSFTSNNPITLGGCTSCTLTLSSNSFSNAVIGGGVGGTGNLTIDTGNVVGGSSFHFATGSLNNSGTITFLTSLGTNGSGIAVNSVIGSNVTAVIDKETNVGSNLTFTGNNSFGSLTILAGKLTGSGSNNSVFGAGTITLGDGSGGSNNASLYGAGASSLTIANQIFLASNTTGTLTIGNSGFATDTFTGGVTGTNSFTIDSTASGGNAIKFMTGMIDNGGVITNINSGSQTGSSVTFNSVIGSHVTGLTQNTSGTSLILSNAGNLYTGTTTISAGTIKTTAANVLNGTALTVNGTLDMNGFSQAVGALSGSGTITSTASGTIGLTTNSGTNTTFSGTYLVGSSTSDSLTKQGSGTLTLSGANTFNGGTTISAGTLQVGNATALGANGSAVSVTSGAVLDLNGTTMTNTNALTLNGTGIASGGALINSSATTGTYAGLITLGSASSIVAGTGNITISNAGTITGAGFGLTIGGSANTSIASLIGTGAGTLTKVGTGTLTLSNAGNTYNGGTNINAGMLNFASGSLGTTGNITFGGGTLQYAAGNTQDITARLKNSTTGAITIDTVNNNVTYASIIDNSNTNGLTLNSTGTGILTLSGANTFTGGAIISSGTLKGNATGFGANAITLGQSGTNNNATLSFAPGGSATLSNSITIASNDTGTLTIGKGGNNTQTYSGNITGGGGGSVVSLNAGVGTIVFSGAVNFSGTITNVSTTANNTTISGPISSNVTGVIQNSATSKLVISNVSNAQGSTTITSGTLQTTAANVLGSGALTVNGTLDMNGFDQTVGSLTGAGVVTTTAAVATGLTVGDNTSPAAFSGVISNGSGTISLTKVGTGTLTLSGLNTYSGATTVNAGTLKLGAANSIGSSSAVTVGASGTFNLNSFSDTVASIADNGTVTFGTGNTLTTSGNQTYNNGAVTGSGIGMTITGSGALTLGATAWAGSVTLSTNSGMIEFAGPQTLGANSLTAVSTSGNIQLDAGATITSTASSGNSIILAAGGNFINNSGAGTSTLAPGSGSAHWLVYSTTAGSDVNGASTLNPTTTVNSTTYPTTTGANGNTWFYSTSGAVDLGTITISAMPQTVTYGTAPNTTAVLNSTYTCTYSGSACSAGILADIAGLPGLSISGSVTTSASGNYNTNQSGWNNAIVAGLGTLGFNSGFTGSFSYSAATLTVNPLAVTLAGARSYDSTANAVSGILNITNIQGSDTINLASGTATLAGINHGAEAITSMGTLALGNNAAGNYTLAGASGSVTINPLAVTLSGARSYDSTNNAVFGILSITDVQGSDTINLSSGTATLAGINHGAEAITGVGTLALGNNAAGNYTLAGASGSVTINSLAVTLSGTRSYDSTSTAAPGILSITDVQGSDMISLASGSVNLASANQGSVAITNAGTLALANNAAGNYTLTGLSGTVTINPLAVTLSGTRSYDSTSTAASGILSITDVQGSDTISLASGSVNLASANHGLVAITSAGTLTLGNNAAGNYTLTGYSGSVTISPLAVMLSGARSYDSTANAVSGILSITNVQGSDTINLASGTATLAGINHGAEAITNAGTLTLGNNAAGNYTLTGLSGSVTINPLAVTLSGTRSYDSTANAVSGILSITNVQGSDTINLASGTATLAGINHGAEAITSSGTLALGNNAAGNYTLTGLAGSVTINPLAVTLSGVRSYDSTANAAFGILTVSNFQGSDTINLASGTATLAGINHGAEAITSLGTLALGNNAAGNYTLTGASGSVTINPLAVTLSGSRTYDSTNNAAFGILNITNVQGSDTINLASGTATLAGINHGAEAITSAGTLALGNNAAGNYTLTGLSGSVTINPLAVTLSGSRSYDSTNTAASGILTVSNKYAGDTVNVTGTPATLAGVNAGSQAIADVSGLSLSNNNYTLTGYSGSVTISPLAVVLSGSKTYDGTPNAAFGSLSIANVQGSDTVTLASGTGTLAGANAGAEAITSIGNLTLGNNAAGNYTLVGFSGSMTITPAHLTVKAVDNNTMTYGDNSLPGLTYTITDYVNGEGSGVISGAPSITTNATAYNGTAGSGSNAGTYAITPAQGSLAAANYDFSFSNGVLTVNKAVLTATANDQTRPIGAANPSFTETVTGFTNGDTSAIVSGSATGSSTATQASPVSTYAIIGSTTGLSLASGNNYTFAAANGTLTVSSAVGGVITFTANNLFRLYGGFTPTLTYAFSCSNGCLENLAVTGAPALSTPTTASTGVGTASINIGQGSLALASGYGLYQINYVPGTLTINPATLTVTANDQSRRYGASNPTFTESISGFVNGDTSDVISGIPTGISETNNTSAPGTYTIFGSVAGLSQPGGNNYVFTTKNGLLTIQPQPPLPPTVVAAIDQQALQPVFRSNISNSTLNFTSSTLASNVTTNNTLNINNINFDADQRKKSLLSPIHLQNNAEDNKPIPSDEQFLNPLAGPSTNPANIWWDGRLLHFRKSRNGL